MVLLLFATAAVGQPQGESQHPELACEMCHPAAEPGVCLDCHDVPEMSWVGSVHRPAAEGDCLDCHDAHASDRAPLLIDQDLGLCGACHADIVRLLEGESPHFPVEECSICHGGHRSEHPALLIDEARALCVECHDESAAGPEVELVHQPAAANCLACHDAHGSGRPALLVADREQLCGICHVDVAQGAHPGEAPVTVDRCLSCHDPHAGKKALLR